MRLFMKIMNMTRTMINKCALCDRECETEKHHLYPIKTRRKSQETIEVCHQCGKFL